MQGSYSFAGKKADALAAVDVQVADVALAGVIKAVLNASTKAEISMSCSASENGLSMSGSFWTPTAPAQVAP